MTKLERDQSYKLMRRAITEAETGDDLWEIMNALERVEKTANALYREAYRAANAPRE